MDKPPCDTFWRIVKVCNGLDEYDMNEAADSNQLMQTTCSLLVLHNAYFSFPFLDLDQSFEIRFVFEYRFSPTCIVIRIIEEQLMQDGHGARSSHGAHAEHFKL